MRRASKSVLPFILTAVAVPVFTLVGSSVAQAESGTFEALNTGQASSHQIERGSGETISSGYFAGVFTILQSSGDPFAEGTGGSVDCVSLVKKSPTAFDLEAHCTIAYSPQDKLFGVFRRKSGDIAAGTGGEGRFEMLGGIGKFSGIRGACPYKAAYFADNRNATRMQCQWQK